jgi:glycosyltransferase
VLVAAPRSFSGSVTKAGLEHAPFDDVPADVMGAVFGRLPLMTPEGANATVMREVFGRLDAQAAFPGVTATIETWKPDIVLREPCEFGVWAAAERARVPQVVLSIGVAAMGEAILPMLVEPLGELRAIAGLPGDPSLDSVRDLPCFTTVPPTFDTPLPNRGGDVWRFGEPYDRGRVGNLPAAWGNAAAPLVYVTFGSVAGTAGPFATIYPAVIGTLADAPFRVLLTTGEGVEPASLGPLPDNVHVECWWPQADVMPVAAAVVGHGGYGTTMSTLAAGLPQVVIPLFAADQFINGARVAELGAGICLDGGIDAVASLPDALEKVLGESSYRTTAVSIADEMASLPEISASVPVLEQLARS